MTYAEMENKIANIRKEGRASGVSFEDREAMVDAIIEKVADEATEFGFGARMELGKEHTKIGTHNRVQYSRVYYPVSPDDERIGNQVWSCPNWATAFGYLTYREGF